MEIVYAKFTPTPVFAYPPNKSAEILKEHGEYLLQAYALYEKDAISKSQFLTKQQDISREVFKTKKCHFCNGKMRYISTYDFWGCENYKNPGQHSTLSGQNPVFYDCLAAIKSTWISDIIADAGLKGKLTAKQLFTFYTENKLPDLREKYGYSLTTNTIESLNKTKRASLEQEMKAHAHLSTIFSKVVYQQCITYKLQDGKEKFCIPDFICSKDNEIFVIDAKLDYCDDEKMLLYVSLVKFILQAKQDERTVQGGHIMYQNSSLKIPSQSKYKIFPL